MLNQSILFVLLVAFFLTKTKGKTLCPFIETLSFGSDFHIQCNDTYLILNESNTNGINWKFANRSSICEQEVSQQASVNQCGVTNINSNYLTVQLKSVATREDACVYCRINGQSMAPKIDVEQIIGDPYILYTFNITATALAANESFEILWAKRAHQTYLYSFNYWFLQGCITRGIKILVNTPRTIVFTVNDVAINRVEFILRRCHGSCRKYRQCDPDEQTKEINEQTFQIPDFIEKLSCDYKCLNAFEFPSLSPAPSIPFLSIDPGIPVSFSSVHSRKIFSTTSKTTDESNLNSNQKMNSTIPTILVGIFLGIIVILLIIYIIIKLNDKKNVYAKTSNVDPDETK